MYRVKELAVVAVFVSVIIATNYGLAPLANIKLEDMLVFVASYVFGLRVGVTVAVLAETVWGVASPYGFGGPIIPFLVLGELVYAVAGWIVSRSFGERLQPFSHMNVLLGTVLAVCAFGFDLETNAATAFLVLGSGTTLRQVLGYEYVGIPFMIPHELSDFVLGSAVAPLIMVHAKKIMRVSSPFSRVEGRMEVRS